jgi:hypothetical protein
MLALHAAIAMSIIFYRAHPPTVIPATLLKISTRGVKDLTAVVAMILQHGNPRYMIMVYPSSN